MLELTLNVYRSHNPVQQQLCKLEIRNDESGTELLGNYEVLVTDAHGQKTRVRVTKVKRDKGIGAVVQACLQAVRKKGLL